ncbi:Cytochrome P450 82A3 [Vitis vinifera]|uniref:Cytochrome P450 82A3 n=1 Tax=Vitis vinifera TaxID=29760 RepID=A0A438K139_VITVI|nr:Cytochrome P450 82A3 [Vitis vinifera]
MADKYGPIFFIKLGAQPVLVVSNWEVAKECFTTNDKAFANRPKLIAVEVMGYNNAMFGFSPYGSYWRQMRKIVTTHLLSNRSLEMLKLVRISEVKATIKELHELWVSKKSDSNMVSVEMRRWFGGLALNLAVRMTAGKRFSSDKEGVEYHKAIRCFFELTGKFMVSDALPFLRWFDLGGYEKAMKKTAKKCLNSDHDTVTVSLTWALSLLLNNRHVLNKAKEELDLHVGRERRVEERDMSNLVYLDAIIKETLRLYSAVQVLAAHESTEECVVGGCYIPAGTRLIINLWKIHHDPSVWSDPDQFMPERFSPRIRMLILIQGFEFATASDGPVDMTESIGLTNLKTTPLDVLLTPRLSSNLYE